MISFNPLYPTSLTLSLPIAIATYGATVCQTWKKEETTTEGGRDDEEELKRCGWQV